MNLTPELINRLVALKSLLCLEDWDIVAATAERLETARGEEKIGSILEALEGHRYAEAAQLIDKILADGTRVAEWTESELSLLEAELARVTEELVDLEVEEAETEHRISRFQAAYNKALGERTSKILDLRRRLLEKLAENDPEKEEEFQQAKRDFEKFQQDQEAQQEADTRPEWDLSEEEERELKELFRATVEQCHPDIVEWCDAEMFWELRDAYDEGDLARLEEFVYDDEAEKVLERIRAEEEHLRAEAGLEDLFGAHIDSAERENDSAEREKKYVKVRIEVIREAIAHTGQQIAELKESSSYQLLTENEDWGAMFKERAGLLDREIESLTMELSSDGNQADEEVPDSARTEDSYGPWLEKGRCWFVPARWDPEDDHETFRFLFDGGADWADPTAYLFPYEEDEEWLDEILARAVQLEPLLSYEPDWPMMLTVEDMRVLIWVEGNDLLGWVGIDSRGITVRIDIADWNVYCMEDDQDADFAAGLVIAWFLDCSMGMSQGTHPHYEPAGAIHEVAITSSFGEHERRVRLGSYPLPEAHRVKGHIRNLPEHYAPTEDARNNAPPYIRRNLGEHQTFVVGYSRGGEDALRAMTRHLREASNVADALGSRIAAD